MAGTENPMAKIVGMKIRDERERQKLTQAELAQSIHTHAATINRIENGVHYPSKKTLRAIAQQLKKPKEFFTEQFSAPALPTGNTIRLEDYQNALQEIGSLKSELEYNKQKLATLEQEFAGRRDLGKESFGFYAISCILAMLENFYTPAEIDKLDWHKVFEGLDMEYDAFRSQWEAQDPKTAFRRKK